MRRIRWSVSLLAALALLALAGCEIVEGGPPLHAPTPTAAMQPATGPTMPAEIPPYPYPYPAP